jgi:hypothetical protein
MITGGCVLKRIGVTLTIAVLISLVFGAVVGNSLAHGMLWPNVFRWLIVSIALAALGWLVFLTTDLKKPVGLGVPQPLPATRHEIASAYYNVAKMYDGQALKLLVNMMIDRPNYLERINENVVMEDETPELQVSTRQIFRVRTPTGAPLDEADGEVLIADLPEPNKTILVPLVLIDKGTLLDGFRVTDSSGNDVPTLSYNQTRGLLAHLIVNIIEMAPEADRAYREDDRELIRTVRANLVTAVCAPKSMIREGSPDKARIEALLSSTQRLPFPDEWKKRIHDFCEILVRSYVIVAEVVMPVGGYVILSYSQRISVENSAQGVANRVRSRLGLRYDAFDIPLNIFALEVETYHMEMTAAPMQYVFDHHLERMTSKVRVAQEDLERGPSKPYVRVHYNSAGAAAHLYIRRQSDSEKAALTPEAATDSARVPGERLKSVIEFREIPPGALGASAVISILTAAIIIFFALTQIGQEIPSAHSAVIIGSDIPALFLALPGLASIVVGSWLDLSHLRRASLSTYVGLTASLLLSTASALYYLLGANESLVGRVSFSVTRHLAIRTNIGWLILATASAACGLFLTRDVISNSRYYSNQVKVRLKRHP